MKSILKNSSEIGRLSTVDRLLRNETIAEQLQMLAIRLVRKLRLFDDPNVGRARLSVLFVLAIQGKEMSMGELAEAQQVKGSTMSHIVDGLEELGFAKRVAAQNDKRAYMVTLTKEGKNALLRCQKRRMKYLTDRLSSLSRKDISNLDVALSIVERLLRDGSSN